jgi:outer membrane protein OmpA-like peptidoglycan-associated protein
MRHLGLLSALVLGGTALAQPALADNDKSNSFSLHLEPGMAAPLSDPQSTIYGVGVVLGAKGMFALTPNVAVGPSVSAMYLPRAVDNGQNAGVLNQFGASLRLQGDRRYPNEPFSPWVDVDLMAAHTGDLWRPAFDVGVGAEVATDQNHSFFMGPFIRYTHMQQTSDWQTGQQLDPHSGNLIQVGWSVSFDYPTPVREHYKMVYTDRVKVVQMPCVHDTSCQSGPVAETAVPDIFTLTEKVYFNHDSDVLRWESMDKLDALVKKLNTHPNVHITVEGHASSDGDAQYNQLLSARRTTSVMDYFTAHGVDSSRLTAYAHGISQPAAPNSTQEGRERNRRVEFTVIVSSQSK